MTAEYIIFEQPLNETIRLCLRLEALFKRVEKHHSDAPASESQHTLEGLLRSLEVVDRPDLKKLLTQTLIAQQTNLSNLQKDPLVDPQKLTQMLTQIESHITELQNVPQRMGECFKENSFLKQVRQHLSNPGGASLFNLPALMLWLKTPAEQRHEDLRSWYRAFQRLPDIIDTILLITRQSGALKANQTTDDLFQQPLDPAVSWQLIRIEVLTTVNCYPEISVGKHRLVVRFKKLDTLGSDHTPSQMPLQFRLGCCRV